MSWRDDAREVEIVHPWWTNNPGALWDPNILQSKFQDNQAAGLLSETLDPQLYGIYGNKFKVHLDVHQFYPNELSVHTACSNVYIHGKHEEKTDEHGFITREFTRRYILPACVDHDNVTASLSPNGILTVKAPRRRSGEADEDSHVKEVPIIEKDAIQGEEEKDSDDKCE